MQFLPAIACNAPPRTPPVKTPAIAPTGEAGAMESLVLDVEGTCREDNPFRLRSVTDVILLMSLIDVVVIVDGFVCRKILLDDVENEYTS